MLSVELFEFISTIIYLFKNNEISKFSKLVMILFIIFHFEQMLDKFEQIDYKHYDSIKLMLPLYKSKAVIVEDLIKICYPAYKEYITDSSSENLVENLFLQPETSKIFTSESNSSSLLHEEEKEQIEE